MNTSTPVNILTRIKDNLIASTNLDVTLVPGLTNADAGDIKSTADLSQIAGNVAINQNMAQAPSSASHARPTMFAFVSSFVQNVRTVLDAIAPGQPSTTYEGLDARVKQDFDEWQGLIAAVALNNIYSCVGLDLSVSTVQLSSSVQAHRCILWEMDKDAYYRDAITARNSITNAPEAGQLFYIHQKGKPFAIFHPIIGLCPMQTYDASIFDGVLPWHHTHEESCHKGWTSVAQPFAGKPVYLSDFCLSRIAWWANQNNLSNYGTYLKDCMVNSYLPDSNLVSGQTIPQASSIDNIWTGRGAAFGKSMMLYEAQGGKLPNLFLDNILISYVGAGNNRMVYNTAAGEKSICFAGNPASLAAYAPVPPFCSELVKLLDTCTLEELSFQPQLVDGRLASVLTMLKICNQFGELFAVERQYDTAHLRQGKMPYMMIWPYVDMPEGMNLWTEYYATWDNTDESLVLLKNASGTTIKIVSDVTFKFAAPANSHNVCCPTRQMESWTVCNSSEPFRQASLLGKESGGTLLTEIGLVFMPAYRTYPAAAGSALLVSNNPVKVAVDFGTTSTVCAISTSLLNGGNTFSLEFRDYSHTVTCENKVSKEHLDVFHWLGNPDGGRNWKWDKKIFSIAQLFDRVGEEGPNRSLVTSAGMQDYYVDARVCMLSGNAMSNFASACEGDADPLRSQQIMNDMKFNETLDVMNVHAASAFLAGIYTHAVLYLLHNKVIPNGATYLELRVSYPNDVTLGALKDSWKYAQTIVDRMMVSSLTAPIQTLLDGTEGNKFYSEAAATTAYQQILGNPLATKPGLVSLDIGGGTTDISITDENYPGDVRTLSLRYAGREIMVTTLIEYFRRFHPGEVLGRRNLFGSLWKTQDMQLMNQFLQLCDEAGLNKFNLKRLSSNSSLRMYIELLLSEGMNFPSSDLGTATHLLRQLIALKFIMVMRVTARAVGENIDLWNDPLTNNLRLVNGALEVNISVSGTSAQLLQYVFDCPLTALLALSENSACSRKAQQCMALFNALFDDELKHVLPEGVKTSLTIFVNQNIAEKREVAYGMLQDSIAGIAATAAAAPVAPVGGVWAMPIPADVAAAQKEAKINHVKTVLRNYPDEKLKRFIEGEWDENGKPVALGLLNYIKAYENIYCSVGGAANCGLGANVNSVYDLLMNYRMYAPNSKMPVSESHAKYMVEEEQERYMDLLACIYIIEDMLDAQMADLQSR